MTTSVSKNEKAHITSRNSWGDGANHIIDQVKSKKLAYVQLQKHCVPVCLDVIHGYRKNPYQSTNKDHDRIYFQKKENDKKKNREPTSHLENPTILVTNFDSKS